MTISTDAGYRLSSPGKTDHVIDLALACKLLFSILFVWTTLALAADVSGRWNGTLAFTGGDGQTQTVSANADLKQQGKAVTGRIWKEEGQQFEIERGQVSGNQISFTFRAPEGEDEQVTVHIVRLVSVSSTLLQGTLEFELGGQKINAKLALNKEK